MKGAEQLRWEVPYVAEADALPLYPGWTETIGIRADGEIVRWSTEGEYAGVRPVEDRYLWLSSLVSGSRRYPELRVLLPTRPTKAVDCRHLSHPLFAEGKVFCPERYLQVVYVPDEGPGSVFVITAYELRGKAKKAYRRRQRRKS